MVFELENQGGRPFKTIFIIFELGLSVINRGKPRFDLIRIMNESLFLPRLTDRSFSKMEVQQLQ